MEPLNTWDRIQEIYEEAKAARPEERAALVRARCGDDAAAREQVMTLLRASEKMGAFLEAPLVDFRGQSFGAYRAVEEIGRGGMSVVYRGERASGDFDKQVAIKVILLQAAAAMRASEVEILAGLEHANIARLLDAGTTALGFRYLVMEYVEGVAVTRYAEVLGREEKIRLFLQICAGVQAAHRSLVVHRDLKPDNVLVTAGGVVKLLDFGIAKMLEPEAGAEQTAGVRAYTLDYASPEQILGQAVTTAADVYSLGVMLSEMLTGRVPRTLAGLSLEEVVERARKEELPAAGIEGDLGAIVGKALRREAAERYDSVGALRRDLERYLEGRPVEARAPSWGYRAGKFIGRNRVAVGATAAAALALLTSTGVAIRQAQLAEERFEQVRKLARTVMFDLHDEVSPLTGSLGPRKLIADSSLEYLDALARDASASEEVQLDLVRGYLRLAEIEGGSLNGAGLGRTEAALRRTEQALGLARRLNEGGRGSVAARAALVEAMWRHAAALLLRGDPKQMLAQGQAAVEEGEKLQREAPALEHAAQASEAYQVVGMAYQQMGEYGQAVEAFRGAVRMARAAMPAAGVDEPAKKRLAGAHNQLCAGLYQAGDLASAEKEAQEALRLDRERYRENPKGAREDLSSDLGMLAAIVGRLKRPKESVGLYEEQLALRRAVAADDPRDMTAQVRVAATLDRLGNAHRNGGEWEAAIRQGRAALEMIKKLWEQDKENRYLLQEWAYSAVDLALSYEKAGRAAEQCAAARESRRLLDGPAAKIRQVVGRQHEMVERLLKGCPGA